MKPPGDSGDFLEQLKKLDALAEELEIRTKEPASRWFLLAFALALTFVPQFWAGAGVDHARTDRDYQQAVGSRLEAWFQA